MQLLQVLESSIPEEGFIAIAAGLSFLMKGFVVVATGFRLLRKLSLQLLLALVTISRKGFILITAGLRFLRKVSLQLPLGLDCRVAVLIFRCAAGSWV